MSVFLGHLIYLIVSLMQIANERLDSGELPKMRVRGSVMVKQCASVGVASGIAN
jgi:hypothetical protein